MHWEKGVSKTYIGIIRVKRAVYVDVSIHTCIISSIVPADFQCFLPVLKRSGSLGTLHMTAKEAT